MRFVILSSILLIFALTGCRQTVDGTPIATEQPENPAATPIPTYTLTLSTDPAGLGVGESAIVIDVTAPDGSPVAAAQIGLISAQGDMTHAGMVPVIEDGRAGSYATDQVGRYAVPFNFNMAGDWIITVTVNLRDGTVITGRLDTSVR